MRLLYLVIKKIENARNKVFREKQAPNKVLPLFLDMKMLEERFDGSF